jgi:TolB-like protein
MTGRRRHRHGEKLHTSPSAGDRKSQWPCLLSNIAIAVSPLRNLTGDTNHNVFTEVFTEGLISSLRRRGRGFSLQRVVSESDTPVDSISVAEPPIRYLIAGSAQRGDPGGLRINIRITDASKSEYLWARRYEFKLEEAASIQAKMIRRISRELHLLLLRDEIRRAVQAFDMEPDPRECLASAVLALKGGLRREPAAEAQQWFLAALAGDPRNVDALVGFSRTCQELVSNPWWSDPATVAVASDLGREVIAIALELTPGHAGALNVQGMLFSAAGELHEAAHAFERALAMDQRLAAAHGFAGYNAAFLDSASQTLPAIERAMRIDRAERRHSIWFFFAGFSELLLGRTEASIALLRQSLERNPSYGSARLFLIAALSLSSQRKEAARCAASFQQMYPDCPASAFEQLWVSRSASAAYRAQILPLFERIREFGVTI